MKQPQMIQTKLNYVGKTNKHVNIEGRSIDVDRVKVYEIKDSSTNRKAIELQPIQLQRSFQEQKKSELSLLQVKSFDSLKKVNLDESRMHHSEQHIRSVISISSLKKAKIKPFQSLKLKIQKIINHLISIDQTNPSLKINSENFYNLFQSRRNLFSAGLVKPKQFFEACYTNYLSFMMFLIKQKQRDYEIYEQFQEVEKINQMIQNQINQIQEIYLFEEEAKIDQIFSDELRREIVKISEKFSLLHQQENKEKNIEKQAQKIEEKQNKVGQNDQRQVQEGQINIKQLSNKSFLIEDEKVFQNALIQLEVKQKQEKQQSIEQKITVKQQLIPLSMVQSSERLFSTFEERQIYTVNKQEQVIKSESCLEKCSPSSNVMDMQLQF